MLNRRRYELIVARSDTMSSASMATVRVLPVHLIVDALLFLYSVSCKSAPLASFAAFCEGKLNAMEAEHASPLESGFASDSGFFVIKFN